MSETVSPLSRQGILRYPPEKSPATRVLWVTNVPLPEAGRALTGTAIPFGGWLAGAAEGLTLTESWDLSVAFPWKGEPRSFNGECARHFTIPVSSRWSAKRRNQKDHRSRIAELITEVEPDLVHIWGTEMSHCLPAAQAALDGGIPIVVSIQGLVGVLSGHLLKSLPTRLQTRFSAMDPLRPTSSRMRARAFRDRGTDEAELISLTGHIIGRTTWDRACVSLQNPAATYHHCDEILRTPFMGVDPRVNTPVPFRVFMAQGNQEYKGLHIALEGLALLRRRHPVTLVVAGPDPTRENSPYGRYIAKRIRELRLEGAVSFPGLVGELEMISHLRSSAAYLLPSIIDNSPNSLCEAMMLGLPCIASYVGGVPDLLTHGVEGYLYPADAPYMLAHYLEKVLTDEGLSADLGRQGQVRARRRHDPHACTQQLLGIYRDVLNDSGATLSFV